MRVLLDTTFARRGPSGTGVYVTQLAAALREAGVEVVEVANDRDRTPGTDLRWTQVELRRRAREENADLVHHPLPDHVAALRVPQVVTVHDLAFLHLAGAFDARFARFARVAHRIAARRADAVIAVSATVAADAERAWGVRAHVARHGPGQALGPVERAEPRHFLYVGDAEPRKDLPTLLAAHQRYRSRTPDPLPLVLAGTALAIDSGVHVVERPTRAELVDLHRHAAALVHASRDEGFGLTVAEALDAGTPVIAADTPALREAAGPDAAFFAAGDVDALADRLAQPPAAGSATLPTWAESAQAHIAAYELACARRRR